MKDDIRVQQTETLIPVVAPATRPCPLIPHFHLAPRHSPLATFLITYYLLLIASSAFPQASTNPAYWYDKGREAMLAEDWYGAAESFLECARLNPAHAEATAALAECYYELGENDEALAWIRKARLLARGSEDLANLEASILIAQGKLDDAAKIIAEILNREPYNREALFTQAELDIARGRSGDAVNRFRYAARRYPDDRRVLVSLALVLGSLGDEAGARAYIDRAIESHPDDYRVYYYAAYLASQGASVTDAIAFAENALRLRPGFIPARNLLAALRYRAGEFDEASRLSDLIIAQKRESPLAWYLKGMSLSRLGKNEEAMNVLETASSIDPNDEFIRSALEELLIAKTRLEDPRRARWASWHFTRARDFKARNLLDQAVFEYRRGLRLNPYARDRFDYAGLLRIQGYPARYLEELKFMQNLGIADTALNDAVESYSSLLSDALFLRWGVDPVTVSKPHWKIAVFSVAAQSDFYHVDAAAAASSYIKDILVHERNIAPMDLDLRQPSFSHAFRAAREAGADYFLVVQVRENERDISISGDLYVARTGAAAASFRAYRTGLLRLRNACRGVAADLSAALPFRAALIRRDQGQGLIDKGRADGVANEAPFSVIRAGSIETKSEGIGLVYGSRDVIGTLTVTDAGEEVSAGKIERAGFFDVIAEGDEIIAAPAAEEAAEANAAEGNAAPPPPTQADPELRSLLRTLK